MKITWEVNNLILGDSTLFEVSVASGHWVPACVISQDGGLNDEITSCCLLTGRESYIGPFQNREALVGWMNTSGRVRVRK